MATTAIRSSTQLYIDDDLDHKNNKGINLVAGSASGEAVEYDQLMEAIAATDDAYYMHDQGLPASLWTIVHNLDKKPSVTTVDTSDVIWEGEVTYIDNNTVTVKFNGAFSGKAYLS